MRTFGDLRGSLKERVPCPPASNLQWLGMKRLSRFTEQQELYRKNCEDITMHFHLHYEITDSLSFYP